MVGMDGRVTLAHKKQMPYTLACVLEILRFSNVSPIGIPHMTTEDTEVDGFHVKKGTGVGYILLFYIILTINYCNLT